MSSCFVLHFLHLHTGLLSPFIVPSSLNKCPVLFGVGLRLMRRLICLPRITYTACILTFNTHYLVWLSPWYTLAPLGVL
jgi:hypothetical protein